MEATQILSSCCRLSLGIVQPCAGCRLSRSCISRIWISRTRARPGQAAPPRGAAGAPPRPPCREGSWISRRRKLDQPKVVPIRGRDLAPPRVKVRGVLGGRLGGRSCRGSSWSSCSGNNSGRFFLRGIGKDVLLLIEDTLEVAKQTFAIGGVVRRRGLRLCCLGVGSQLRGPSPSTWSVSAAWTVTELSVSVSTAWN